MIWKFLVGDKDSDRFILVSEDSSILIIGEYESDTCGGVKKKISVFSNLMRRENST